jgi:hypothetical protein
MRQSGTVAAAGIVALETMIDRLQDDHANARALAEGFQSVDSSLVDAAAIETNIVRVDIAASGRSARQWVEDLFAEGIWTSDYGRSQLRFVTHRHIGHAEVEQAETRVRLGTARTAAGRRLTRGQTRAFPRVRGKVNGGEIAFSAPDLRYAHGRESAMPNAKVSAIRVKPQHSEGTVDERAITDLDALGSVQSRSKVGVDPPETVCA